MKKKIPGNLDFPVLMLQTHTHTALWRRRYRFHRFHFQKSALYHSSKRHIDGSQPDMSPSV